MILSQKKALEVKNIVLKSKNLNEVFKTISKMEWTDLEKVHAGGLAMHIVREIMS